MLLEVSKDKWNHLNIIVKPQRRKANFRTYFEPFRPFNCDEITTILRYHPGSYLLGGEVPSHTTTGEQIRCGSELNYSNLYDIIQDCIVSYQALTGGFTICNIIVNGYLHSGSSHCSKIDQWLPIRGQMLAFKRALESTGIELPRVKL
jgi:hypothetical protein